MAGPEWLRVGIVAGWIAATYLLVLGMFIAAITAARGIPGGGSPTNRFVAVLYFWGSLLAFLASGLLFVGLAAALV